MKTSAGHSYPLDIVIRQDDFERATLLSFTFTTILHAVLSRKKRKEKKERTVHAVAQAGRRNACIENNSFSSVHFSTVRHGG